MIPRQLLFAAICATFYCLMPADATAFTLRQAPRVESHDGVAGSSFSGGGLFAEEAESGDLGTKSTTRAVLYSLLLPGLGHRYIGDKGRARGFFVTDALIWTAFIMFQVQGDLREDGYQEYAQNLAGVTRTGHSDDFYSLLTEYNTSINYEDDVKSEGRFLLYPDVSTEELERYFVENRISDFEAWAWPSDELRRAYQDQRAASKRAYRRSTYMIALALANRAFASFLVVKDTREYNRHVRERNQSFHIEFGAPRYHAKDGFQTGVSIVRKF